MTLNKILLVAEIGIAFAPIISVLVASVWLMVLEIRREYR